MPYLLWVVNKDVPSAWLVLNGVRLVIRVLFGRTASALSGRGEIAVHTQDRLKVSYLAQTDGMYVLAWVNTRGHAASRAKYVHKVETVRRKPARFCIPKPLWDDVQPNVNRGGKKWEKYETSICKNHLEEWSRLFWHCWQGLEQWFPKLMETSPSLSSQAFILPNLCF